MSRPLAVLRPEPGNAATAARIVALGRTALRLPLFEVVPLAWTPPDPARFDALLATSANAFRHGGEGLASLRGLPVHAVGAATARAARAAGFIVAQVGDADVAALVAQAGPARYLHLAGREHRGVAGTETICAYATVDLTPDLTSLAGAVALVHSPRAAARLAALLPDRHAVALAAISPAARDAAGEGWRAVAVAAGPSDTTLIAAAIRLAD